MKWRAKLMFVGTTMSAIIAGCDDERPAPAETPITPPADITPAIPTTQALLEGPRKSLSLQALPFKIDAPESWKIVVHDARDTPSITMIEGPCIGDEVRITLGLRAAISAEQLKIDRAKSTKDDAEFKKIGGGVKVTEKTNLITFDRRRMPTVTTTASDLEPSIEWRLTLLVPSGIGYEQYAMQFIGMTQETYKKNEEFLSGILATLTPDDSVVLPSLPK